LADEVDVSRGDMIAAASAPAEVADQFDCTLVWMDDEPLLPGRSYWLKLGTNTVSASITDIRHQLNVNTLEHVAARRLELNAIAACKLSLDRPVPFDAYAANRDTGGFILIDRMSHRTAGAGMLRFALRRAHNIHLHAHEVNRAARAALKGQRPCVVWLTGLSGSGKSTIANLVEKALHARGRHTYLLDGDNVRHGLNRDLGFTPEDRVQNIRRIAEVARLMTDAGLIVLTAFISPYRAERAMARGRFAEGEFIEVHVDAPLEVAEARDPKGLYRKARRGELRNFTGIDAPYEAPEQPELRLNTASGTPEEAAQRIVAWLQERGMLGG
ncbi:MAG: adenylyl-sulfate kinase, partial [Rubrivivax sp.]